MTVIIYPIHVNFKDNVNPSEHMITLFHKHKHTQYAYTAFKLNMIKRLSTTTGKILWNQI